MRGHAIDNGLKYRKFLPKQGPQKFVQAKFRDNQNGQYQSVTSSKNTYPNNPNQPIVDSSNIFKLNDHSPNMSQIPTNDRKKLSFSSKPLMVNGISMQGCFCDKSCPLHKNAFSENCATQAQTSCSIQVEQKISNNNYESEDHEFQFQKHQKHLL